MRWSENLRQAVRREFALLARTRAWGWEPLRARQVVQEVTWLAPQPQDRVLDLACGPGSYTSELARRARFVVGADLAPEVLRCARRSGLDAGRTSPPCWVAADAYHLPFAGAAFDLILCGFSFAHFPAAEQVAGEIARVLGPGGRAVLVDLVAGSPLINRLERLRERIYTRVPTGPEFVRQFREAGLRLERERRFRRPTRFRSWAAASNLSAGSAPLRRARRLLEQAAAGGDRTLRVRRVGSDLLFEQPVAAWVFRKP